MQEHSAFAEFIVFSAEVYIEVFNSLVVFCFYLCAMLEPVQEHVCLKFSAYSKYSINVVFYDFHKHNWLAVVNSIEDFYSVFE